MEIEKGYLRTAYLREGNDHRSAETSDIGNKTRAALFVRRRGRAFDEVLAPMSYSR